MYLLDILIFVFNVRIGTHFMMLLGILMICAVTAYGIVIINDPHIVLPWNRADCEPNPEDGEWCTLIMEPTFGWSFYLVLFTGLAVFFTGVVLFFLDFFVPRYTAAIFHHNIIEADEDFREVSSPICRINKAVVFMVELCCAYSISSTVFNQ